MLWPVRSLRLRWVADAESLKKSLKDRQSELVSLSNNLVDLVWGSDRPPRSLNPVFPLSMKFTGTVGSKVALIPY